MGAGLLVLAANVGASTVFSSNERISSNVGRAEGCKQAQGQVECVALDAHHYVAQCYACTNLDKVHHPRRGKEQQRQCCSGSSAHQPHSVRVW